MPPNKVGVTGLPAASITCAPAGALRPRPTARTMPPDTSTSAFSNEPCAVAVWTVALRISTFCADAAKLAHSSAAARAERAMPAVPATRAFLWLFIAAAIPVIPAKAGIHFDFAFALATHPAFVPLSRATAKWVPAFAGMTAEK